jgi:3-phenylpropionate/trans-cinnamate dioxygenase ferredoxin subunit
MSDLQKVASLSEIPDGHVKAVELDGDRVVICNVGGALYAISDICSHDYALLSEGELDGNQITCPRHGARFDVQTGKALCLPAVMPVATYKVEVKDGDVYISTPENS